MVRKLGIAVVVLLVVGGGAAWYLLSSFDSIVKGAIEKYGSEATQATVTVESVSISLRSGEATISGLVVGNPEGFATANALTLGSITVKLDAGSLLGSGPIVIRQIDVVAPHVTYEVGAGGSNLQTIQKNAQDYAQTMEASGNGPSGTAASSSGGEPQRKLIIEDLTVRDGQVGVSATILEGRSLTVPLPTIHLANIGKEGGGAAPAEVAYLVLGAVSRDAVKVGAKALTHFATSAATGAAEDVTGGTQGLGKRLKGLFGN